MPKRKDKSINTGPTEDFRIYLDETIRDFLNDPTKPQLEFPNVLTNTMRAYIHEKSKRFGLKSRSHGKEPNRVLSLYKATINTALEDVEVELSTRTQQILAQVHEIPTTQNLDGVKTRIQYDSICKVCQGSTINVPPPLPSPFIDFKKQLPIFKSRELILQTIRQHQVVIISAETGSGKTTQIPQYILEDAAIHDDKVRVICTQPRRLSTVSVAERVAAERGEQLGHTIGYQIKLESKLGTNTAVVYCTNGVLLRTMMAGDECFQHISHIIVDEIHERDKFTDFLMIILRQATKKFPRLRLILMSATMDMEGFQRYFDDQPYVLNIEGRSFACCSWFLEDVLKYIGYENARMKEMRRLRERNGTRPVTNIVRRTSYANLDPDCTLEVNETLMRCFGEPGGCFDELMQLYLNENVDPNFQDWAGRTALMAAAKHGNLAVIEQLLNMGADTFLASGEGITASGWAQKYKHMDVVNMLTLYQQTTPASLAPGDNAILSEYVRTVNDEFIDFELIVEVIKYIHFNLGKEGAILVFLPGYEDIVACHERITASNLPNAEYEMFMLHGSMEMKCQYKIFQKCSSNRQKIILSTNIAETSITIDDVRFVIDSGKAKVKTYDARTGISSLTSEWISMASSRQRAGRAGRTQNGYCFHLYSMNRYESFYVNAIPEILRTPLHELCLQAKILAPQNTPIADFLNLAIDPPQNVAVEEAIMTLKRLGALDEHERMTYLGHHLVQFSIEPRLGKMLLYSVIFKCLDPVLTIVASLAQKDPFVLPSQPHLKKLAVERRKELAEDALSDHVAFIRLFQNWQESKVHNRGNQYCYNQFISQAVMELIVQTRSQLLSQLRAMKFVQANYRETIGDLNSNSSIWPLVKCCIAAGLYPNVALRNNSHLHGKMGKLDISVQSSLKQSDYNGSPQGMLNNAWVIYDEISKPRAKASIKTATVVTPLSIALLCGQKVEMSEDELFVLDNSYALDFNNPNVIILRNNIQHLIMRKIVAPFLRLTPEYAMTIRTLIQILVAEDRFYGIPEVEGIGKRPLITHMSVKMRKQYEYPPPESIDYDDPAMRSTTGAPRDTIQLFPFTGIYFIIKPFEEKNVHIALKQGVWNFSPATEKKLFKLFAEGNTIFLIFHVRHSASFFGVAKLVDTNQGMPNQPCPIIWITSNTLPIISVKNIIHAKVHLREDGMQLDSRTGQQLCKIIYDSGPNKILQPPRVNSKPRPILGNYSRRGGRGARAGPSKIY